MSGAAPCPWELAQDWRARTGVRIVRGYGMTELFRPLSYLADDPTDHAECVGRPVPGVEIRVVDDGGRALPAGETGELSIRTPAAMDGYLDSPEDTRGGVRRRLVPHRRPRARVTADGYVRSWAASASASSAAATRCSRPRWKRCSSPTRRWPRPPWWACRDPELGEEIAAFVTLRPGAATDADELIAWCRERLAAYKYPRRVVIVPELPKSATGKILTRPPALSTAYSIQPP